MHALDWIQSEGRLRRTVSAAELRRVLSRKPRHCTWCGLKVSGRRQTWCSTACTVEFRSRADAGYIRSLVLDRDRGVCAVCGLDTQRITNLLFGLRVPVSRRDFVVIRRKAAPKIRRETAEDYFARLRDIKFAGEEYWRHLSVLGVVREKSQHLWEADHIIPVCLGGGLSTPENYRTLCLRCHAAVTRSLSKT